MFSKFLGILEINMSDTFPWNLILTLTFDPCLKPYHLLNPRLRNFKCEYEMESKKVRHKV